MSQWNAVAMAAVFLLGSAFLLGGASRLHELRLALVQLSALPLLVLAAQAALKPGVIKLSPLATGILAALVALPLLQITPLPPAIWTQLAGRDQGALALEVIGIAPGWTPLTLAPDKTWRSFLALVPPVAMFLAIGSLSPAIRLRFAYILIGLVLASIILGALQLISGSSRLYPWPTTDTGNVVGIFANRNHFATLCLVSLPFATALGARAIRHSNTRDGRTALWLSALFLGLVVVVLGVTRSRMGVALLMPALAASLAVAWIALGRGRPKALILYLGAGMTAVLVAVAVFALGPILERFDTTGSREGRFENWPLVLEAADNYLPFGSGLGSFDAVFRSVEPLERLDATYFNQAHNDYLETWLETGWLGMALIIAFIAWFARRAWTAWRSAAGTENDLQRAASVAIGVVMLHSFVDYPLRTETMAVVFAMCCGVLELAARAAPAHDESGQRQRVRKRVQA